MKYDNDILIEYYIVKAISFNGGISGTSDVLLGEEDIFCKRALNKINFEINTGAQETHEVCWREDFVQVTKSSNFSDPDIIHQVKLYKYENNDLFLMPFPYLSQSSQNFG